MREEASARGHSGAECDVRPENKPGWVYTRQSVDRCVGLVYDKMLGLPNIANRGYEDGIKDGLRLFLAALALHGPVPAA